MAERSRIVTLHGTGMQIPEIAAQMHCSTKTVRHWIRTHQAGGDNSLRDHRQFNRGFFKTTADEDNSIRDYVLNVNPYASSAVIKNDLMLDISPSTIRRRLFDINFINVRPAKKTVLTPAHRDDRVGYALQYLVEPIEFWENVIAMDEKTFSSSADGRRMVWRPKGERLNQDFVVEEHHSGRITCGFWGFISTLGVGEVVEINARMNAEQYVYILDNHFLPNARRILPVRQFEEIKVIEDHSAVHRAHRTEMWYERHPEITRLPHPAKSPDLNPIENVWSCVVRNWRSGEDRTRQALIDHVHQSWEDLRAMPQAVANCIFSMPKRLNSVVDKNGYWTKY